MERWVKLAVADGNELFVKTVTRLFTESFKENGVFLNTDIFTGGSSLLERTETVNYDMIVISDEINENYGINIAKQLKKKGFAGELVFLCSKQERAFDYFALKPLACIQRDRLKEHITDAVQRFVSSYFEGDAVVCLELLTGDTQNIRLSNIMYIVSLRHEKAIYLENKKEPVYVRSNMQELALKLEKGNIYPVHKSYMVNFDYIKAASRKDLVLDDGTVLPIGRSYCEDVQKLCNDRYFGRMG